MKGSSKDTIVPASLRGVLATSAIALAAALPSAAAACEPSTSALPHPAGYEFGEVLAFGPAGLIGGTAAHFDQQTGAYEQVSVLWRRGRPSIVGDLPQSFVADINSRGDVLITGGEWPSGRAVVISRGVARELPGLGGGFVFARRLNDRGDVAGSATLAPGAPERPVIWRDTRRPTVLPLPDGADGGFLQGINEQGDAVGGVFGETMASAWIWRADGGSGPLHAGDWGPDDPGFGVANVIDQSRRVGGASGPLFAPGAVATIWTQTTRRVADIEDGWAIFYGTNDQGDFVGGAFDDADRSGTLQTLLMRYDGPPLALLPLSGNAADEGLAHAVSRSEGGDVTVGGFSTPRGGGDPRATLWRCAYTQAVPYDETASPAGTARRHGSRAHRAIPDLAQALRGRR